MTGLALLAFAVALAVVGYFVMIDVKPGVERPVLEAKAQAAVQALEPALMGHVRALAGEIGERNVWRPEGLRAAAEYIRRVWTAQGFSVVDEEVDEVAGQRCANLVVERRGNARPGEIVLVGAHYDSLIGTPGANDNATGVAVLLELSRALESSSSRTLRLVAFVNEEPPHFRTEAMGSRVHARAARRRGETIVAMLSLETLGYYSQAPRSQRYPFPFGAFYPTTGNFLGVVGNLTSRDLVREFMRHFMAATDFPVEGAATFAWVPGVDWSDHGSFWLEGYPAVMLTDTAPYRYPQYHSPEDLPDRVNARELGRAAHGIIEAVRALAAR